MTRVSDIPQAPTVAVVGGGFSGLLTALHLLARDPEVVVRLVEKADRFGLGRAYAAANGRQLLNVRAANMSAFPDRPDDFIDWLTGNGGGEGFVSRARYGEYLQALLRQTLGAGGEAARRLLLEKDEVVDLSPCAGRFQVQLALGRRLAADAVVLATGLGGPSRFRERPGLWPPVAIADPWTLDPGAAPAGDILLIGSGLTMVDVVLALDRPDRRFLAISRHGLLPEAHEVATAEPLPAADLRSPRLVMRALRAHAARVGWRSAVDGIRPLTPAIWRGWTMDERRRFLRHARAWWDVRRHRMAPEVAERIAAMLADGRLRVAAGRLTRLEPSLDGVAAQIRPRGAMVAFEGSFSAVVDCTGLSGDLDDSILLRNLRGRGLVRPDQLRLGLDVDDAFRPLSARGQPTPGLFAIGPLTRAARWETVAVPDLRSQTAEVASGAITHLRRDATEAANAASAEHGRDGACDR